MLAILPILSFALILLAVHRSLEQGGPPSWRASMLFAAILWGTAVVAITELLSLFTSLTMPWVAVLWGVVALAGAASWLMIGRRRDRAFPPIRLALPPPFQVVLAAGVAAILLAVGLVAFLSVPNTWDSMTYHMSRVVHWIQNRSVAFYPTHIQRQLTHGPWAEFAILHFQLLTGGDRLANFIQWFSMAGSVVGVSLIAQQLGASAPGQMVAAVFAATIPMGILQASGTKNDFAAAFWLTCCVYSLLLAKRGGHWASWLAAGTSLGLAFLTKATAYIYAAPFLAWLGVASLRARRRMVWRAAVALVLLPACVNLGHYARNMRLYGHPLGYGQAEIPKLVNEVVSVGSVVSNSLRNLGLHLGVPVPAASWAAEGGIRFAHRVLAADIDDPRTTLEGTRFQVPRRRFLSEDYAGNPFHLALMIASVVLLGAMAPLRRDAALATYALALMVAFVAFAAYLKWQPWHSRLHLPLFVLWAPVVGVCLSKGLGERPAATAALVLVVASGPWLLENDSRPLVGSRSILRTERMDQYFLNRRGLGEAFRGGAAFVKSTACSEIGLWLGADDWEYPLWLLLKRPEGRAVRIEHINVRNQSAAAVAGRPGAQFRPCSVVSLIPSQGEVFRSGKDVYTKAWSEGALEVFVRRENAGKERVGEPGAPGAEGLRDRAGGGGGLAEMGPRRLCTNARPPDRRAGRGVPGDA